jgi:hypothetical protein
MLEQSLDDLRSGRKDLTLSALGGGGGGDPKDRNLCSR